MCAYYVKMMCAGRFGLRLPHDVFTFACHMFMHFSCHMFMHFSCIHTNFVFIILILNCMGSFRRVSLSLSFISCSMAPKRKSILSRNPLILGHLFLLLLLTLLHLTSSSMIIKLVRTFRRTFHNAAFIRNTKSY